MDVKLAAIHALQQAGTALNAKEITERIMAAGLWHSEGKTPDATVSARLYSDIKSSGDNSPFVKVGLRRFQDENDPACGRGWAVIENGELNGRIYLHLGDDSAFRAIKGK